MNDPKEVDPILQLWKQYDNIEDVLLYLRNHGFSKIDSVKALHQRCAIPLSDAKRMTFNSNVWLNTLGESIRLEEAVIDALKQSE